VLEPVHDLLRVGHAALKPGWNASPVKCSFTARKVERDSERFSPDSRGRHRYCLALAREIVNRLLQIAHDGKVSHEQRAARFSPAVLFGCRNLGPGCCITLVIL